MNLYICLQDLQDFIDNTQTHKCVTWGHNIYTVLQNMVQKSRKKFHVIGKFN
jgi:DNA-binding transcriptional regulator LsrR (DeoR family)